MPDHPRREQIVGTFHTVEELMNLPKEGLVDPRKAREVSRALPIRFWMAREELMDLLARNLEILLANQLKSSPEEAQQIEILLAQRQIWLDWLSESGEEEAFVGLFPASPGGDAYDDEAGIRLEDDDPDAG